MPFLEHAYRAEQIHNGETPCRGGLCTRPVPQEVARASPRLRVCMNSTTSPDMGNRMLAQIRSCTTERREKLQDDGIGREQSIFMLKRMIEGGHPLMPIIASQEESNPIECIGKETPHGYRFGKP